MSEKSWPRWPLLVLGLPAMVAIWSGWVGLGGMSGFGLVTPLPGIRDDWQLNTAITLPIGMEAYSAIAMGVWLSRRRVRRVARAYAMYTSLLSLFVGLLGQAEYHVLESWGYTTAPTPVVIAVACLPVLSLGLGAGLYHLMDGQDPETEATEAQPAEIVTEPPAAATEEAAEQVETDAAPAGELVSAGTNGGKSTVDPIVTSALAACETKAEMLQVAWRMQGVEGVPTTSDVMPAVAWLAEHGVRVDPSGAYGVRRNLERKHEANQVRTELAVVGGAR